MRQSALVTLIVILTGIAMSATAQSSYHVGLKIESFTSVSAALTWVNNNLDTKQKEHAALWPMPIIDGPLSQNPPDAMSYIVIWQPSSNDSTDGMTTVSATSQTSPIYSQVPCIRVGTTYGGSGETTTDGLQKFNTLSAPPYGPFIGLLPIPTLGSTTHILVVPGGNTIC